MTKTMLVIFLTAFGFVAAALVGSVRALATGSAGGFRISRLNPANLITRFFYFMAAGPFLVALTLRNALMERAIGLAGLMALLLLIVLWSICSGILILQSLISLGILAV